MGKDVDGHEMMNPMQAGQGTFDFWGSIEHLILKDWEEGIQFLNLKCDEDYAQELRAEHESIEPGWHMSKKLWNSVYIYKGELQAQFIFQLIDHSYDMVIKGMPKNLRETL